MDRSAVFVDAGYLFAQGGSLVTGKPGKDVKRGDVKLDEVAVINFLTTLAQNATKLPLLRIYWYDGTNAGPTPVHISLGSRNDVKVRLGIVNAFGEQKGVDALVITDMITLSRHRAMADAVLITGDEDLRVGVQQAQEFGVRVHLVGIEDAKANQSRLLRQEADTLLEISKSDVQTFLTVATPLAPPPVLPPAVPTPAGKTKLDVAAEQFAGSLPKAEADRVVHDPTGSVPWDIDKQLLRAGSTATGGSLTQDEKRELRRAFIKACKARP